MSNHTYFYPIKSQYLVPMQNLWDSIKSGEKVQTCFRTLRREITLAGVMYLPTERQVRALANDILGGKIPRPTEVDEKLPSETSKATDTETSVELQDGDQEINPCETIVTCDDFVSVDVDWSKSINVDTSDHPSLPIASARGTVDVSEEDPINDAVDIIVKHYQEKAFAKARHDAAMEAARALRHFADKVEASA